MALLATYWPLLVALTVGGCVSGVFAGLLGVGGGVIIVPILSAAFEALGFSGDVSQHVAVASSLAGVEATGCSPPANHALPGMPAASQTMPATTTNPANASSGQ